MERVRPSRRVGQKLLRETDCETLIEELPLYLWIFLEGTLKVVLRLPHGIVSSI